MKNLLIILLLLSAGCCRSKYQEIYKDDILRSQYNAGYDYGYREGYSQALNCFIFDSSMTVDKFIKNKNDRWEKLKKEYDK